MTTVAGLEVNTLADGLFHVATWLLVLAGSVTAITAWQQGRLAPNWRFHFGLVLAGWGLFDVLEGVIDHQVLGVHHVRDDLGGPLSWDIGFLVSSAPCSSSEAGRCTDGTPCPAGPGHLTPLPHRPHFGVRWIRRTGCTETTAQPKMAVISRHLMTSSHRHHVQPAGRGARCASDEPRDPATLGAVGREKCSPQFLGTRGPSGAD